MVPRLKLALLASLTLVAATACDDDDDQETNFEATLTGAAERPDPVTTTASGTATVEINDAVSTFTYSIDVQNLSNATAAHTKLAFLAR